MNYTGRLDSTDLTTLARVKALIAPSITDTSQDALFSQLITEASRTLVDYLGLHATEKERTEVYQVRRWQNVVVLDARPVDAAQTFTIKHQGGNEDWSTVIAMDSERAVLQAAAGYFRFRNVSVSFDGYVQVVYTGGLGANTAAIITAFPDIAQACDLQVKYLAERAHTLAGSLMTGDGGKAIYEGQYGLLGHVRSLVDRHRRWGMI